MKKTFKKRPGTTNRGIEYEEIIAANLVLNLVQDDNIKNFALSSNDEGFKSFDDVVAKVETKRGVETYALQLKHISKNKRLSKEALSDRSGKFSILKYFETCKDLVNDNTRLILFTNLKLDARDGDVIYFDDKDKVELKFRKVPPEPLLNTSSEGRWYRFEVEEDPYKAFFKNFFLCTGQASVYVIKNNISRRLQKRFSCGGTTFIQYLEFINRWNIRSGVKPILDKKTMKHVLVLCLLEPFIESYSFTAGTVVDPRLQSLREIISSSNVTNVKACNLEHIKELYSEYWNQLPRDEIKSTALNHGIVTNIDEMTKTKILWLCGKCPLILPENECVVKTINFCQEGRFIVLLDKHWGDYKLRQFPDEVYKIVVNHFFCSVQGRSKVALHTLVHEIPQLNSFLSINELLRMLDESFTIGGDKEDLPLPYIGRRLSSNTIDFKFLEEVPDDTLLVIDCRNQFEQIRNCLANFKIVNVEEFLATTNDNTWAYLSTGVVKISSLEPSSENQTRFGKNVSKCVYISQDQSSRTQLEELLKKQGLSKFCHFKVEDGKLEVVNIVGNLDILEKHRRGNFIEESQFFCAGGDSNIQIVCGEPGMGKSSLLKHIKNNQPPTTYTKIIYAKEHSKFFKQKRTPGDFLKYIVGVTYAENTLDSEFLQFVIVNCKITFMWDGLDEVSTDLENVLDIINELFKMGFSQIMTSRNNLKSRLENKFGVLARNIKPFDEEEQNKYVQNRLKLQGNEEIILTITRIIEMVANQELLSVPLHLFLLTELLMQNSQEYQQIFNQGIFSISDLYEHFIQEKFNIYFKQKMNIDNDQHIHICKKERIEHYKQIAEDMIFGTVNPEDKFLKTIKEDGDYIGIMTNVTNEGIPIFIHQSFAEYFAAKSLYDDRKRVHNYRERFFEEKFDNVRFFFDLMLASGCSFHLVVLYKNVNFFDPHETRLIDAGGRNPLHLACSWGERFFPLNKKKIAQNKRFSDGEKFNNRNILYSVVNQFDPYQKDNIFQIDAFSYANESRSLFQMILLTSLNAVNIRSFSNFEDIHSVLTYAVKWYYLEIFDVPDLATVIQDSAQLVYLGSVLRENEPFLRRLLSVKECLKKISIDNQNFRFNRGTYGTSKIMWNLLVQTDTDINLYKKINITPLGLACRFGNLSIVNLLREHGANINIADKFGDTPVVQACSGGHIDVINIFKANNNLCEAKYLKAASINGHVETLKFLLELGADVNAKDKESFTALHSVCFSGQIETAHFLLENGADVNAKGNINITPLLMASFRGYANLVQLLVKSGARTDMVDITGFTPLHYACVNGFFEIVCFLIENKADVNAISKTGMNPLFQASFKGCPKIVKVLLDAGIDVNQPNKFRATPLHVACFRRHVEVVRLLLEAGADVTIRTLFGLTAQQVARGRGYTDIVSLFPKCKKQISCLSCLN